MKLLQFRITHYKSIIDSGDCRLAEDMTVLIGKNESGKTALLEALQDFDRERFAIAGSAHPLGASENEEPALDLVFQVTSEEWSAIEQDSGVVLQEDIRQAILKKGLHLRKSSFGEYAVQNKELSPLLEDLSPEKDIVSPELTEILAAKRNLDDFLNGISLPELILDKGQEAFQSSLKEIRVLAQRQLLQIPDEKMKEEAVELLRAMMKAANSSDPEKMESGSRSKFIQSIVLRLPRFVFFNDFKDILPFEISMRDLKENQAVLDFARIAKLDLNALFKTEDLQKRMNVLNRHSAIIAGDFLGHWDQNKVELVVQPESDKLLFGVKETGQTDFFKIEQRSKGFQWFLSFYLKLKCYQSENIVVLIDEPGMHLHPVAQKDILHILKEKANESMQIIFSTHSPFFLNVDKLDRVRFVIKDREKGSVVSEMNHPEIDEETLMPLETARAYRHKHESPEKDVLEKSFSKRKREIEELKEKFDRELQVSDAVKPMTPVKENEFSNEREYAFSGKSSAKPEPAVSPNPAPEKAKSGKSGMFGWLKK